MAAGLAVTLEFLQGPTRQLVASALAAGAATAAAGAAADLLLAHAAPAHCLVLRQPYDDDVFAAGPGAASDKAGVIVAPLDAAAARLRARAGAGKPLRPVGGAALARIAAPRNVAVTGARNVGLAALVVVNGYFTALYEEEEDAAAAGREPEVPPFPEKALAAAARRGCTNAACDWAIQLARSLLDWAAAAWLPLRLSRRLRKELRAAAVSAARKGRHPAWARAPRVARAALFSEATLLAADWAVTCALEAANAARFARRVAAAGGAPPARALVARRLAARWALQGARCAVALVAVALGYGLGSAVPSERWRWTAMFLCAQGASFSANAWMNAWIVAADARLFDDGGGGGGSGGGAGGGFGVQPPPAPPAPAAAPPAAAPATMAGAAAEVRAALAPAQAPPAPAPEERRRPVGGARLPARAPRRAAAQPGAAGRPAGQPGDAGPETPVAPREREPRAPPAPPGGEPALPPPAAAGAPPPATPPPSAA
jgi:hypothetical protein